MHDLYSALDPFLLALLCLILMQEGSRLTSDIKSIYVIILWTSKFFYTNWHKSFCIFHVNKKAYLYLNPTLANPKKFIKYLWTASATFACKFQQKNYFKRHKKKTISFIYRVVDLRKDLICSNRDGVPCYMFVPTKLKLVFISKKTVCITIIRTLRVF